MKKILIVVFLYVGMIGKVYAAPLSFRQTNNYICDGEHKYNIYNVSDANTSYFFINPSPSFNINMNSYYEVPFESTNLDPNILDYTGNFTYLYKEGLNYMLSEVISKMLWEYLYPEKNFVFCDKDGYTINSNNIVDKYNNAFDHINNINKGLDFFNKEYYLKENIVNEYEIDNLNQYYIYDTDGLNVNAVDNKLSIIGSKGNYNIVFKKNPSYFKKITLLTDGTNYLLSLSPLNDKEYYLKISIGYSKLTIKNSLSKENICYDISKDSVFIDNYCTDENGSIDIYLENGEYVVKLIPDINNDEFEKNINLTEDIIIEHNIDLSLEEEKEIIEPINKNDNIKIDSNNNSINKSEEYISIIPKDTFSYKYLGLFFLLLIGICFVKKNHK